MTIQKLIFTELFSNFDLIFFNVFSHLIFNAEKELALLIVKIPIISILHSTTLQLSCYTRVSRNQPKVISDTFEVRFLSHNNK